MHAHACGACVVICIYTSINSLHVLSCISTYKLCACFCPFYFSIPIVISICFVCNTLRILNSDYDLIKQAHTGNCRADLSFV